jgi:hypothetical protein
VSRLEGFYDPVCTIRAAASWDNSRSGVRTDAVLLYTREAGTIITCHHTGLVLLMMGC